MTLMVAVETNGRGHEAFEALNMSVQLFARIPLDKAFRFSRVILGARDINTVPAIIDFVK